ncbi:MAG TPA: 16S rRNA (guanine(527)-N(7))-methyltransferase RsmG [Burkholderiaceae bacterium]|nr:16S rRNA (guanine(527)-N(7))-methyltransferase RsmG [Burkholderiaceae bacterium]
MGGPASSEILRAWQQLPVSQARPLSQAQADQLAAFLEGMSRWNAVHNITAVGAEASVPRHILDALVAWPSLLDHLGDELNPVILDVGSGNGVPGLPWAVVAPSLQVHLVERVARKAAFLRRAARDLGLSGRVSVFQESVESGAGLVAAAPPQGYAIIASRAFAALEDFLGLTWQHAGPGTCWLYMAGKLSEIKGLSGSVYIHPEHASRYALASIEPVRVPGQAGDRHLIWIRRAQA